MTGPEFALAVLVGLIANAIYDVLRNPAPPVPKQESGKLFQDNREFFKKLVSRVLPSKKADVAGPTVTPENSAILKKSADAISLLLRDRVWMYFASSQLLLNEAGALPAITDAATHA